MRSLRSRVARLSRTAAAADSAGRLIAIIAWGDSHATVRSNRWAWSLVVPWTEDLGRGGLDEALAALGPGQRSLIRPQDKLVIRAHPPGSEDPRINRCGL